jgi:hypothetical protein
VQAWIRRADRVVEPKPEEIRNGAAMYPGMASLVEEHKAQAIAVDCLELFHKQKMFAYPCLGFFQLNNDGLVGACEADLASASTILLRYLTGRAGSISDPVIDTAKNQIIYAHCVAPSKVYGPGGPECVYEIRDHSEDRKGAAIRSILPPAETLSTLEFVSHAKTAVFHLSRAVDNGEVDLHGDGVCERPAGLVPHGFHVFERLLHLVFEQLRMLALLVPAHLSGDEEEIAGLDAGRARAGHLGPSPARPVSSAPAARQVRRRASGSRAGNARLR